MKNLETPYNQKFLEEHIIDIIDGGSLSIIDDESGKGYRFGFCDHTDCDKCHACGSKEQGEFIAANPSIIPINWIWIMNNIRSIINEESFLCANEHGQLASCGGTYCDHCVSGCDSRTLKLSDWIMMEAEIEETEEAKETKK